MRYFDAHNHLQDEALSPHLPRILDDLVSLGITAAVVNGTLDRDWPAVSLLARSHPWIIPSYGIHPWYTSQRAPDWQHQLNTRLDQGGVIGEIGLDRWKPGFDIHDQTRLFRAQLQIAAERNLPATIHCLRAWGPLWDILRADPVPDCGFLLHAYGGPVEMLPGFITRGAYFSFNASFLAHDRPRKLDPFREIPLDRLLVETDAPSMPLPPEFDKHPLPDTPAGDKANNPANITVAYAALANLRQIEVEALARQVEQNFNRLFGNVSKAVPLARSPGRPGRTKLQPPIWKCLKGRPRWPGGPARN